MSAATPTPAPASPEAFDPLGPLPRGTTVLEASAGTGKTWAVGALVTRYVAEGRVELDEMLVITFGRAASQELRERVREQLVRAEAGLRPDAPDTDDPLLGLLRAGDPAEVDERRRRLRRALADFDGATIATTHQFCQQVLRSLGVAGDTDTGAELVDDLDDLVVEVLDDLYLARFGGTAHPPFSRATALQVARAAVGDPQAHLVAAGGEGVPQQRLDLALAVRAEVDRRKRRLGLLSYDDLLTRLRDALGQPDSPAAARMRQRWRVVLVDEFQDTDPVQWEVLDLAFTGVADMVLIGDPKQAIYAFRGGDVAAYLQASGTAGTHRTLATNWRSDQVLVDALQTVLGGAELGDPRITVLPVRARHQGSRLASDGGPTAAPLRLRLVEHADGLAIGDARDRIAADLAAEVASLLGGTTRFDGRALRPTDVAVLLPGAPDFPRVQAALAAVGIASVVAGGSSNVVTTEAGRQWLTLLEALEQPHRAARVRAVALTAFVGHGPSELDAGGDALTDEVGERVRRWLDLLRARGVAAVHEAVVADGLGERVLGRPDGERLLTDLHHLGQVLHEVAHRDRLGVAGLLEWLRSERARVRSERTRRLDTDAQAVQLTTMHSSKGLQFPVVMLPLAFNRWRPREPELLFHDADGRRCRDVGGGESPSVGAAVSELAGEELRLTYVALTRAQSQVVCWWAPTRDSVHSGLSRLLLGRGPGESTTPRALPAAPTPAEARRRLQPWVDAGGLVVESADGGGDPAVATLSATAGLAARVFDRGLDTDWRRTSYSGLISAEDHTVPLAPESEPEDPGTVDETAADDEPVAAGPARDRAHELASPMDALPSGATLGSLVHAVLEHVDPGAPDLRAELAARIEEERRWWAVATPTDELADALLPSQHTPMGPLVDDLTLAQVPLRDRLRELDFEVPLAGGDRPSGDVRLAELAPLLRRHLPASDPMRPYADRLEAPTLGGQRLRGYLSGQIDLVLRVGSGPDERYVVADYKTNRLGTPGEPLTSADYAAPELAAAMLHSHYPLQALLYSAVVHRYLRWRLPASGAAYDPDQHLGGVLYLYLRGMCGPGTPRDGGDAGVPHGVFSWRPPASAVVALSDLLAGLAPGGAAS